MSEAGGTLPAPPGGGAGEAERRFRAIVDSAPDATLIVEGGRIMLANRRTRELFGYDPDELVGAPVELLVPERFRDAHVAHREGYAAAARRREMGVGLELRGRRRDGSEFPVEVSLSPLDGSAAVIAAVRDVTDRSRAREALRDAERRFRAIVESAPDATLIVEDGVIVLANRRTTEVFGYAPAELLGQPVEVLMPERFRTAHVTHRRRYAEAARPREMGAALELRGLHRDGGEFPIEVSLSPLEGTDQVIAAVRDVSERVAAQEALLDAERRFRLAFAGAPVGMALVAPDGALLQVNRALCRLTGRDEAALLASRLQDLVEGSEGLGEITALTAAMGAGTVTETEHRVRHVDGSTRWVALSLSLVDGGEGRPGYGIAQLSDIQARKDAQAHLAHQTLHDPLTGLGNRLLLVDRVQQAIATSRRSGEGIALLFIDLDRFKTVNDRHGHAVGDEVLRAIARRIDAVVRPGDTVVRLGGDEFVVLCTGLADEADVTTVVERLQAKLDEPFDLGGALELTVTASIGVVLGDDAVDVERLLQDADTAMYRAKALGRARAEVFDAELRHLVEERRQLEEALEVALGRGELSLAYQPLVDLRSGRVTGHEALLRWAHPNLGAVPPARFLDVAEASGLIVPIGAWVLHEAARTAAGVRLAAPGDLTLTVNCSRRQLQHPGFSRSVLRLLEHGGLPPSALRIDVTETALLEAGDEAVAELRLLAAEGIGIGLDDFGSDGAAVSSLTRLPLRFVKVDHRLVARVDHDDDAVRHVEAALALARIFEVEGIAEGVERPEQAVRLAELGCRTAQGFLLGRPSPVPSTTTLPLPAG
jgi:diguanylate cyclase (GGDEF)-like protein/PAS domain S-box-containing protein